MKISLRSFYTLHLEEYYFTSEIGLEPTYAESTVKKSNAITRIIKRNMTPEIVNDQGFLDFVSSDETFDALKVNKLAVQSVKVMREEIQYFNTRIVDTSQLAILDLSQDFSVFKI